jgi:antimicrobial peptide system SdpB family protein
MPGVRARVLAAADSFEPRGWPLAIARSALALAELAGVLTSSTSTLFIAGPGLPDGVRCAGARGLSLWCLVGSGTDGVFAGRVLTCVVLVAVVVGYRPRWTCVPQWYVTWSLTASVTLSYGADAAAVLGTTLLVPVLLGDDRTWHWTRPTTPLPPRWRGSAYAAWLALRCQITIVYLDAAITKLTVPQWRDGTAMYTVFTDPNYGVALPLRHLVEPLLTSGLVIRPVTWSVIVVELGIAACALGDRRVRRLGVALAIALHAGIVVAVGLVGFGLVMIGLVVTLRFDGPARQTSAVAPRPVPGWTPQQEEA